MNAPSGGCRLMGRGFSSVAKVQNSDERSKSEGGAERMRSVDILKAKSRNFAAFCNILIFCGFNYV